MRASIALFLTAIAIPAAAQAQTFSPERIRADVTFLADDLLEGRNAGERGYEIAARYVATEFEKLGLQPGNQGSYFQQVPLIEAVRKAGAPSAITIGQSTFVNGTDVVFYPFSGELDQDITAEAVFVGYGLDNPQLGFNDYAGLDVRGKIVIALWGFPPGSPSEPAAHLNSEKARMAQERGAIGMLSIYTPMLQKLVSWDRMQPRAKEAEVRWALPDGKPFLIAPAMRTSGWVHPRAAEHLFAGSGKSLGAILAEAAKPGVKPKGFALRPKIRFQRHSVARRMQSPNVIAILPGSDPSLANEYILLMGHLDHDGIVEPKNGDRIMNGAMDNAAGIATMLEVARAFAASGKRPKRSLLFAAVTAEEDGLLGSDYLARNPVTGAGKVVGVVNLDMPILTYDFEDVVAFGAEHSTISQAVARAAPQVGIKLSPDPNPEQVIFVRSDHYSFVKQGVPAVALDTGSAGPGEAATADFLANHYHQVSDEIDLPFNWNAGAKFARLNYLVARDLADAPQRPLWYEKDYFGDLFARQERKAPKP
jgi:hypothetical protein